MIDKIQADSRMLCISLTISYVVRGFLSANVVRPMKYTDISFTLNTFISEEVS